MSSRLGRRVLSHLSRPNLRVHGQTASRRSMSSPAHGTQSSDRPWIIASALVFGTAAVYLISPPAKAKTREAQQHSLPKKVSAPATPLPVKDDEGTEVPVQEVQSSAQAAYEEDSPKDAQASEEKEAKGESSEGETVPAADTTPEASIQAEESPVPTGTDPNKAETEHQATGEQPGTLQGEESTGAADESEARERAKSGQDPKQAAAEQ